MADKKGAGPTSKKVEIKKPVTSNEIKKPVAITEIKKPVPVNGPTSKQAFRKVEEEQRARLAKQRKAEEEWLQNLIEKEEDRRKRIQVNFLLDQFRLLQLVCKTYIPIILHSMQ
jgi:hypothetical protein